MPLFRDFVSENPTILFQFVNDGSTDGTNELLDNLSRENGKSFRVLHLERNSGKAEAVRRGMQTALDLRPIYVGYWDADLATPLGAILDFIEHLEDHRQVQMVLGARVRLMGHRILRRQGRHYLGRAFATIASLVLGIRIYDTQCGAKLFRATPTISWLFHQPFSSRWIFDVEILARFLLALRTAKSESSIDEVIHEIPLTQWEEVAGSKVKARDFLKAFVELWMIHCSQLPKKAASTRPATDLFGPMGTLQPTTHPNFGTTSLEPVGSLVGRLPD